MHDITKLQLEKILETALMIHSLINKKSNNFYNFYNIYSPETAFNVPIENRIITFHTAPEKRSGIDVLE